MPSPGIALFLNLHLFTNQEASRTYPFGVFMEASLYCQDWLKYWSLVIEINFSLFSSTQRWEGAELQSLGWLQWQWVPILRYILSVTLLTEWRYFSHSQHLGSSKSLGSNKPGTLDNDQTNVKSVFWFSAWTNRYFSLSHLFL